MRIYANYNRPIYLKSSIRTPVTKRHNLDGLSNYKLQFKSLAIKKIIVLNEFFDTVKSNFKVQVSYENITKYESFYENF